MAAEFTMPKLGLTMTDGTIREWLVDDGTFVQAGEPILVIETDKVETEVEARADGILRVTGVVGSTYECGAVIGYVVDEATADDIPELHEQAAVATPGLMAVPDVDEPTLFGDDEHTTSGSLDEAIAAADGLASPEVIGIADDVHLSDEAIAAELDQDLTNATLADDAPVEPEPSAPVSAEALVPAGVAAEPIVAEVDVTEVVVAEVEPHEPVALPATELPAEAVFEDVAVRGAGGRILASPRARATAYDAELDLATVAGTGPGGRIVHDDVAAAITARAEAERAEADRRHAERLEAARQAEAERLETERLEAERAVAERLRAERAELDRIEAERLENERLENERLEEERLEAERAEAARAEAQRAETERLEAQRAEAEQRETERLAALPAPPVESETSAASAPDELVSNRPLPLAATRAQADSLVSLPIPDAPAPKAVAATGGARLLADFLGIDLADVGAPSGGRITREDVGAWVRERLANAPSGSAAATASPMRSAAGDVAAPHAPAPSSPVEFAPLLQEPLEVVPFRGMRGLIAERMHSSLAEMAQLTLSVDVDMVGVNAERERRRSQGETVPGYTAWVVAAAAQAIEEHGYINSQITAEGIAVLPDVHVGVAVALDEGLIVPVIEHANLRTVEETHSVVADLAGRARVGKLQFQELEGATFSVTALGMYGVDMFTPVINPPNTAILGVGRLRSETGWSDGRPVEKTVMTLSLTWDHRAFDGAPAAEFAQTIVRLLQEPTELV